MSLRGCRANSDSQKSNRKAILSEKELVYMLSERDWWIILTLAFIAVSLIFGLVIIPFRVLEYNLAINFFTSSIFMFLTILLLTLFINLRETIVWKKVKDEVHFDIVLALGEIFKGILDAVENGHMTKMSAIGIQNKEDKKRIYFIQLRNLKDAKEIKLDQMYVRLFLEGKGALEPFSSVAKRLSDIQLKYYRFLSPELTISLMKIQRQIFSLETLSQLVSSLEKIPKEFASAFPQAPRITVETFIVPPISFIFKKMSEEIYELHQMGYEIYIPY